DTTDRKVVLDLGRANNRVSDWEIQLIGKNRLEGFQQMGKEKVYFSALISDEIENIEKKNEGESEGYALVKLKDGDQPVVLKIGLSFVSTGNARENLEKEIGDKSLDDIRKKGVET